MRRNLPLILVLLLPATLFASRSAFTIFPKLNPHGEAFRLNGYRFPGGHDAEMTKIPPVPLGAEGYKKLWPKSIWPGEIPGMPPLAVLYTSAIDYDHEAKNVSERSTSTCRSGDRWCLRERAVRSSPRWSASICWCVLSIPPRFSSRSVRSSRGSC